ncbi:MAG: AMP-binding protein [Acidimicrobiales bacterium]|nr:AMP-binding protein [Acidimicrobiales bacterium]
MPETTIADAFLARAEDDNTGLLFEDQRWTWREVVAESAARAATILRGDHIGLLLENVPDYAFWLGAAALKGAVVVGINPTRRGEELARDIRHTDCSVVITDMALAPLLNDLDTGCETLLLPRISTAGVEIRDSKADPSDLYCLIFTSGSTGAPKAVQVSQGRAASTAAKSAVAFGPGDVLYCSMPLFHGNALFANFFPGLISGAAVALRRKFSAGEFMDDVRRYDATYFNYVGRALSYILAQPPRDDDADNKLKYCLGSEASPADRKEFRRRFGCLVVEGYSSSEGGVIISPYSGMPKNALGRPAEGADVVVINAETGHECPRAVFDDDGTLCNPTEAIGEIVGRDGLGSFEGYYNNPEANEARSREGWYWTGDLGYRSDDGTFFFAGRTSDWLRVDGENFAAGPVEAVIARCEGVRAVVVYPVPDPRTGDRVMAAIEIDGAFDADAFDGFLTAQSDMGTKWAPSFVRVVDAIPLTATGKVDRNPLRAQRWDVTDGLWWKPERSAPYKPMTEVDVAALNASFGEHGREGTLA